MGIPRANNGVAIACVAALFVGFASKSVVAAPAETAELLADQRALLATVKAVFDANMTLASRVRFDFTYEVSGWVINGRYRQDGHKWYCASVADVATGFSVPFEQAWDGEKSYTKDAFSRISIDRWEPQSRGGTARPDYCAVYQMLRIFDDRHLGDLGIKSITFTVTAVSWSDDHSRVKVQFSNSMGWSMQLELDAKRGMLPVQWRGEGSGQWGPNKMVSDSKVLNIEAVDLGGQTVYYPTDVRTDVSEVRDGKEVLVSTIRSRVTPGTLVVGGEAKPEDFQIGINPCDTVTRDGRQTRPTDRKWDPRGKMHFPWDIVVDKLGQVYGIKPGDDWADKFETQSKASQARQRQTEKASSHPSNGGTIGQLLPQDADLLPGRSVGTRAAALGLCGAGALFFSVGLAVLVGSRRGGSTR
jgi:hypothetical protein